MQPLQMRYSKGLKNKQNGTGEKFPLSPIFDGHVFGLWIYNEPCKKEAIKK